MLLRNSGIDGTRGLKGIDEVGGDRRVLHEHDGLGVCSSGVLFSATIPVC